MFPKQRRLVHGKMNSMSNLLFEVSSSYFKILYLNQDISVSSWSLDIRDKTDSQKREIVNDFIVREGITLLDYSNSLVLWSNDQSVLVPANLFENSTAENILNLNFGDNYSKNTSDYNRIPLLNSVCVYSIPTWIKSLFVLKFSGTKIIHSSTAWLNYLLNKNSIGKIVGLIILDSEILTFTVFSEDKPLLNIQTKFQEIEDVIYHVTYAIQQMKLNNSSGNFEVFDLSGNHFDFSTIMIEKLNKLDLLPKISISINDKVDQLAMKLCV
jgi:hypothetical protein